MVQDSSSRSSRKEPGFGDQHVSKKQIDGTGQQNKKKDWLVVVTGKQNPRKPDHTQNQQGSEMDNTDEGWISVTHKKKSITQESSLSEIN